MSRGKRGPASAIGQLGGTTPVGDYDSLLLYFEVDERTQEGTYEVYGNGGQCGSFQAAGATAAGIPLSTPMGGARCYGQPDYNAAPTTQIGSIRRPLSPRKKERREGGAGVRREGIWILRQ